MNTKQLQAALNELGFGPLVEDGIDGPKTRAAVESLKEAQTRAGIDADGIPGPITRAALSDPKSSTEAPTRIPAVNPTGMITSELGLREIASHEGIVLNPYKDSVGVWTIGIGHTARAGGLDPTSVEAISLEQVMELFATDISKFENRVRAAFAGYPIKQHQFDAAVSFDYNTGSIDSATWPKLVKQGASDAEVETSFMQWRKPPEIIDRRKAECKLFLTGHYSGDGKVSVYPAVNGNVQWSKGKRQELPL